jgi:hypothetical protein
MQLNRAFKIVVMEFYSLICGEELPLVVKPLGCNTICLHSLDMWVCKIMKEQQTKLFGFLLAFKIYSGSRILI